MKLCTTLTVEEGAKVCSLLLLAHSMFATGSCDGTTRIWSYKEGGWVSIVLRVPRDEMNRYVMSLWPRLASLEDEPESEAKLCSKADDMI